VPRGFKVDREATEAAQFLDKRSFISMPKLIVGENEFPEPHFLLMGEDKALTRADIFRLNYIDHQPVHRCYKCRKVVVEYRASPFDIMGQWHHLRNKPGTRCDCVPNGVVSCPDCHREAHPHPQFGRAEKYFKKLKEIA
jgi:hypothetical protein